MVLATAAVWLPWACSSNGPAAPDADAGSAELDFGPTRDMPMYDTAPDAPADPCTGHAFTDAAEVRVFAVQPKVDLAYLVSLEAFREHVNQLVDSRVKPCLATDRPNLIVFPESMSLPAMLLGSRGALARKQNSVIGASVYLLATYKDVVEHYAKQWPDLQDGQKLLLALTDMLWRAVIETTRDIAERTGAWVITSASLSGEVERSTAADELAALADPDLPGIDHVFVARAREVYNTAFVFSPQGEIVARRHKTYLVPSEEGLLGLAAGRIAEVTPVDLGFARVGLPTCKDGWMPDVVDRLAILGAELVVQPVAFQGWAVPECADPPCTIEGAQEPQGSWGPDVVKQSAWLAVQKHGALRHGVIAQWTGNALDMVMDGQSAVFADGVPGQREWAYVGQDPSGGFASVAPWVVPDPGIADPQLTLEQRREQLREVGESLRPGGTRENRYVETVVGADVSPSAFPESAGGTAGVLGASAALAPAEEGEQSFAALDSDGAGVVVAAWQDTRDGLAQIYLARSTDGGATFGAAQAIAAGTGAQHTPAVLVSGGAVHVAWQEVVAGERRIRTALSTDSGETFAPPTDLGTASPADEWLPAIAVAGGQTYVAFAATVGDNVRVHVARSSSGGPPWQVIAADGAAPVRDEPNARNNQWAPAIVATASSVHVTWIDYRNYNWDVFVARSLDSGATFEAASRVDDGTDHYERIHDDPALAIAADGTILCGWSDVRLRQPAATARVARLGASGASSGALVGAAHEPTSAWRPRLAVGPGGAVLAAWQELGDVGNDIYLAKSSDGGKTFAEGLRVDDGGDGLSYQFAPRVAWTVEGRAVVVWEDSRAGRRQIRYATGTP